MNEKKRELLNALISELNESEDMEQTSLFTAEELGTPADVVRTMINDVGAEMISVLGEFFFMPYEDEEVLYFSTAVTISEEIPAEYMADLENAAIRLNTMIPCGCFATGIGGDRLIYRYTAPFLASQDTGDQVSLMLTAVGASVDTLDRFTGYLALVADGKMSADEAVKLAAGKPGSEEG